MPLAKLSERFYQKFGHDLVEELVTWLNQMDATYRSDLREVNELNFARFDAKMEQRFAEFAAKTEQRFAQCEAKTEQRIAQCEAKMEQRFAQSDIKLEQRMAELRAGFRSALADQRAELIKWMFVFWAGNVATMAGLMLAFVHLMRP